MNYQELVSFIKKQQSFLCVGLDPDLDKIPPHLLAQQNPIFEFNKAIIDATAAYCVAYKPNTAFYEALGISGWQALIATINYIKKNYPHHFIIADAKRGDIGNTSTMYAKAFFNQMQADAVTVAPYMGEDSVKPFLNFPNKWAIVLGLTSNEGANNFQLQSTPQLYQQVLQQIKTWGTKNNLMFVIGATKAELFKEIRTIVPDNFLLVPGVGAQGGSLHEVAQYGLTKDCGLLINASRSIIYASKNIDFDIKAAAESKLIQQEMGELLKVNR